MIRKLALGLIIAAAVTVLPLSAQEGSSCAVDVTDAVIALLNAQAAGAQGDTDTALAQIAFARETLSAITAECLAAGIEPALLLEGIFAAPNGSFAFNYPDDWVDGNFLEVSSGGQISLGSTPNAMAQMTTGAPEFETGEQGLTVAMLPLAQMSVDGRPAENAGDAMAALLDNMPDEYSVGDVQELVLDDRLRVHAVAFTGENFSGYLVTFNRGSSVVIVAGGGDGDSAESIRALVEAVALTVR